MTEPTSLSAEDARQQMQRMRVLPVDQVIGDAVFMLFNAAQLKLGRRDARLLIDISALAHEHARPYLPDDLITQIDSVLGQLRMAQVSAEGNASDPRKPEANDLDRMPIPPRADPPQPPS